jgi:hypothetical protein
MTQPCLKVVFKPFRILFKKMLEYLLAHNVVMKEAKVQLPETSIHEVYLPNRQCRWLYKIGFICYLSLRGC